MSINTIAIDPSGAFAILPDESILTSGNTADVEIRVPATLQGPKRTESAKGRIWVTDHRFVFVSDASLAGSSPSQPYDAPPTLESLVIPYTIMLSSTFHLPTFAPNHLLLNFLPDPSVPDPGLPSPGRGSSFEVKVVVGEGAGHGVWKRVEGERCSAEQKRTQGEVLPAYTA